MADSHPYPVARIGIIGGGQLGRMLVAAVNRLGCTAVVLDPTPGSPAGQVASHQIVGDYHDAAKLRELVDASDVTTFDIEDIDAEALIALESEGHRIHPSPSLLAEIQDKVRQKHLLTGAGIPTAEFVETEQPSASAFSDFGYPLVQKARRGGYDGRGVAILHGAEQLERLLPVPSLVERFVPAEKELAVVVARGLDGETVCYPVVEMTFRPEANILDTLLAPARIDADTARRAQDLGVRTVEALGGVGVFGIEMFLKAGGELLVNEVAPRTHNSGHFTIEACVTDQFEQHLRAITGLPLGRTDLLTPTAMINLLGAEGYGGRPVIRGLAEALAIPGVSVHIYGKAATRPNRKMGHVTVLDSDLESARASAMRVSRILQICGEDQP